MIRVLVVEDEPRIADAHRAYVDRLPQFTVVTVAGTGRDALRAVAEAAKTGEPVDLVLLDIGLPDMSGLDVAAALSGIRPSPDIIAVTSARDLEVVRTAVARGIVLYLLKPFTFAALSDKLDHYLAYRNALGASADPLRPALNERPPWGSPAGCPWGRLDRMSHRVDVIDAM